MKSISEKFTSAYLFQIAREKSCDYLLIIYTKKKLQKQILTARAFLVDSTDWLKQTTNFFKFKLFQDQRFQNHSAKNVEKCKDLFHMVTSLIKITWFTVISKSKCF